MFRNPSRTAAITFAALALTSLLLAGCSGGGSGPSMPPSTASAADKELQALLEGLTNAHGEKVRIDDPRATVSGGDGGTYSDSSDPKYHFGLGRCELFERYLVFNAVNGALASGFFDPTTDQGRQDLKMLGDYRTISVVKASQGAAGKTEFQQRLEAYASCDKLKEIYAEGGMRVASDMLVARLPNAVDSGQSFAASVLSRSEPQYGRVWVGGSKGGIDVIYTQDVSGDSAPTLDAAAAAAEGAAAVNAVLAKIP